MKNKKEITFIDKKISDNVAKIRKLKGKTIKEVAETLGISLQQQQKCEKGLNRFSASRVYKLSKIFNIPIEVIFDSIKDNKFKNKSLTSELITNEERELLFKFRLIKNKNLKKTLISLIENF